MTNAEDNILMTSIADEILREALRRKGIGPKGSKKLPASMLQQVLPMLSEAETNRTTAAAFWTACLLLDNSDEEEQYIAPVKQQPGRFLLPELQALTTLTADRKYSVEFLAIIRKLIERRDLSVAEAQNAMEYFWKDSVPEWMKGAFLQAERIKRESFEENIVFFDSLWVQGQRIEVDLPILVDLCDSYDGTNRSYHLTPFVAALLGASGVPTVLHGIESLGPKYGITTAQILRQAGKSTTHSLRQAKENLLNPDIHWCYVDQSVSFPQLFAMRRLRHDMVKRPFLATFDKLLQPIHNRRGNIVITGYVHAHYRSEIIKLLSLRNQNHMAFNLRSIEGSTNCWGKKPTPYIGFHRGANNLNLGGMQLPCSMNPELPLAEFLTKEGNHLVEGELLPEDFGIHREDHRLIKGITALQTARGGLSALQGERGLIHDLLIYQAAAFLWLSRVAPGKREAAEQARETLQSKKAWRHWQKQI